MISAQLNIFHFFRQLKVVQNCIRTFGHSGCDCNRTGNPFLPFSFAVTLCETVVSKFQEYTRIEKFQVSTMIAECRTRLHASCNLSSVMLLLAQPMRMDHLTSQLAEDDLFFSCQTSIQSW